jgi:hypothetical protein
MKDLSALLADLDKEIAFSTGHELRGINFRRKPNGWTTIIKIRMATGACKVSYLDTANIADALDLIYTAIHSSSFSLKWYDDHFGT